MEKTGGKIVYLLLSLFEMDSRKIKQMLPKTKKYSKQHGEKKTQ